MTGVVFKNGILKINLPLSTYIEGVEGFSWSLSDDEVHRVAKDPNASLLMLHELACLVPGSVLENPARPLWALEDPALAQKIEERARKAIASSSGVPDSDEVKKRLAALHK